ncbi:MAG: copper amine oxidase N-terminal domain-containing protein [Clostridiales bacterium]|jgi:hypothetical protein|nr:copper amine oxidase N-terminal domain-containing protein [Clostridiales bacterium]
MKNSGPLTLMIMILMLRPTHAFELPDSLGQLSMVVSSVSRLDLSGARITGEKAMYSLELPSVWTGGLMIADREKIANGQRPLDKLIFYYQPMNKIEKPVPVFTLCAYSKVDFKLESGFRILLETERYIFTIWTSDLEPLPKATDEAIYRSFLKSAKDDQYMTGLIRLASGDSKVYRNNIWVNGRLLKVKSIVSDSNVTYLPIRDICESLGYNIGWIANQKAITIARGNFYQALLADNNKVNNGYNILMENDKSFISSHFFTYYLGLNVEIDDRSNVLVNEF